MSDSPPTTRRTRTPSSRRSSSSGRRRCAQRPRHPLDDVGFGAASAFGGPCSTPTAERLAAGGLKYNRFHTTALCSPTRAALLTGRNHHTVGMGGITEIATSAPGYNSLRPNTCAPLAETLKLNGYSTAQFGKCHEVPVWQTSPMGPFDHWPTAAAASSTSTGSSAARRTSGTGDLRGTTPIEPEPTPEEGYHFTEDMTDKAIDWVRQQKALMPDKPFFVYFAPGRHTRAPPRAAGVVRQVQGPVRRRLGRPARADACAAEGAGGRPRGPLPNLASAGSGTPSSFCRASVRSARPSNWPLYLSDHLRPHVVAPGAKYTKNGLSAR